MHALTHMHTHTHSRMDYWFAALPDNRTCIIPGANPCVVYFSFCQGLPLSTGDGCYEAAVCQAGMTSEGNVSYSMGQLNEQTQFFEGMKARSHLLV